MKKFRLKANLKCFSTHWEHNGNPHSGSIFAKTLEEAEEMLIQRKQSEMLTGCIIVESCLNPLEFEVSIIEQIPKA